MQTIAIEASLLFGDLDTRGVPSEGLKKCRVLLTIDDDGQITNAKIDNVGYLEYKPQQASNA